MRTGETDYLKTKYNGIRYATVFAHVNESR